MNILYLHGYGSSGNSSTVKLLKKAMPDDCVFAPDIPVDPKEALPELERMCRETEFDIAIGTSMGAMYAQQLHGKVTYRICINPAFHLSQLPEILHPGTFDFYLPRQDGHTRFTVTEDTVRHFREMEERQFDHWQAGNPENLRCYGFFGTEDTTVNCRDEFARLYPNVSMFDGGHRMNNGIIRNHILPLVEELKRRIEENKTAYNHQ